MKKSWWMLSSILAIPMALAGMGDTLSNVWQGILRIGDLSALGLPNQSVLHGFTRLLIWILLFTVFWALLTNFDILKFLNRKQAGIVAFVIATISAVFMPVAALFAIGGGFATIVALFLIGGPVVGIGFLLFKIGDPDTRATVLLKLIIVLCLFWVLSVMKNHIGFIGGGF